MDFNYKNFLHIIAALLMVITFFVIIITPILSIFNPNTSEELEQASQLISSGGLMVEVFVLFFQFVIVISALIVIPILWYVIVNRLNIRDVFKKVRLTSKNIDIAFLWGILSVVFIFILLFIVEFMLIQLGVKQEDLGNIQDLEGLFSPVSLFLLVAIQPVAEEFFFRGFLLEKIEGFAGQNIAIISTSILFGVAHLSYGKLYPAIIPIFIGIIFAYIVIKTKNLYAAIIGHVLFNVTSFLLYIIAKSII